MMQGLTSRFIVSVRRSQFAGPARRFAASASPPSAPTNVRTMVTQMQPAVPQVMPLSMQNNATQHPDRRYSFPSRRYCLLDVGHAFEKGDYADAFLKFFSDKGETWEVYNLREGNWPAAGDEQFDAFVVGGSWADAYADDEWIVQLRAYLRGLHERQRRIFGCCFGAQVIAHALGGRTGPSTTGWEIGVVECTAMPSLMSKRYAQGLSLPSNFRIHQSHYDQVMELPEGAEVLASSATTPIEAFAIGENVLCVQGHPEWDDEITSKLLDLRIKAGAISKEDAAQMQASLGTQKTEDTSALTNLCLRFLKAPESDSSHSSDVLSILQHRVP